VDALTGLPDAGGVHAAVAEAVVRQRRHGGIVTVIALGVDDIAVVNDAHGFTAGDALLAQVATRLRDAAGDAVAGRVAGDTFAVVVEAGEERDAVDVAVALRAALAATPFLVGAEVHPLRARVGIATMDPAVEASGHDLVERASASLAHARALGGLTGSAESEALHGRAEACDRIRAALGGAVAREELELAFSPAWRDGELVALEAQLRWNGALGFVSPDAFLPVADQTGDIITIGEWALRQALAAFADWRASAAIGDDVDLVLGVTPVQLRLASLPDAVIAAVADAGIPLQRLVFEANRPQRVGGVAGAAVDARLAALGVRVAGPGEAVPGATREDAIEAAAVAGLGAR
jgi:diguanylate cyclase (GGDEF)-like protein